MTATSTNDTKTYCVPGSALGVAAFAIAICAMVPIALVRFLPINDYPFHLARTVILARFSDTSFDKYYDIGSFLVPNLAMDAVTHLLSYAMAPETAARFFIALSLLVLLTGTVALHRTVHGRLSPWPFLAVVLLHNGIFRFGFFNYLFGLGLALIAAAIWHALPRGFGRNLLGFVFACILMLCHMEAFGVFAVTIGSLEIFRSVERARSSSWPIAVKELALSAVPFVAALVLFVVLSPNAGIVGQGFAYASHPGTKFYGILYSLSSGVLWLDVATVAILMVLFAWLALTKRLAVSRPLAFVAAMMSLVIVVLPPSLMGSLYVDTRLGPALAFLLIAVFDVRPVPSDRLVGWAVLTMVCVLSISRTSVLSLLWIEEEREITPIVKSLDTIAPGATIFAATAEPYPRLAAVGPKRQAAWHPPLKHVASYAVLNKAVFVPMTWADPTKQPLIVNETFAPVKAFQGNNPVKVPDQASFDRLVVNLTDRLRDKAWPKLDDTYLLLVGSDRLQFETLPPHVRIAESGRRHVLFQFHMSERP